jgi:hypothetical protein
MNFAGEGQQSAETTMGQRPRFPATANGDSIGYNLEQNSQIPNHEADMKISGRIWRNVVFNFESAAKIVNQEVVAEIAAPRTWPTQALKNCRNSSREAKPRFSR